MKIQHLLFSLEHAIKWRTASSAASSPTAEYKDSPGLLVFYSFCYVLLVSLFVTSTAFGEGEVLVDVVLSPAGSFQAKTKAVKGYAVKNGDTIEAKNVIVDLKSLSTGIGLRDTHAKKRLMTDKYPVAKLINAKGSKGVGKALIEIKGKKRLVEGTYKIVGKQLHAEFPMKLSELEINDVRYMTVGVKDEVKLKVVLPIQDSRSPASE